MCWVYYISFRFLDSNHVPKVAAHLPASTSEELNAIATSMTEKRKSDSEEVTEMPHKKKMKLKGRNKKRPRGNRQNVGAKLCTKIVHGLECGFAEKCQYSHDIATYVASKPADVSERCYVFETYGRCPFGVMCMFSKRHVDENFVNVVDDSLYDAGRKTVTNLLDNRGDLQTRLWKKRYDFTKANTVLKDYDNDVKQSGNTDKGYAGKSGEQESQPTEMSLKTDDACRDIKSDVGDTSGVETAGIDIGSCKLDDTEISNKDGDAVDHLESDQKVCAGKNVSSNGGTDVVVSTTASDNDDIPQVVALKVERAGPVSDEDTIKLRPLEKKKVVL